jgi:HAD superfamily hydrolase (TIGR01490 family)
VTAGQDRDTPPGYAFFDVDDTLVLMKTMFSFQDYYFRHAGPVAWLVGGFRAARFDAVCQRYRLAGRPREELNRMYYQTFAGRRPAAVGEMVTRWYSHTRTAMPEFYRATALQALRRHQEAGDAVVLVSGSMLQILQPIADDLSVPADHVLATRVAVSGGRYTGEIIPPQTIGAGKAEAVTGFMRAHDADPAQCWAYGDHESDFPMLETVGHAVVVSDEPATLDAARERGWDILPAVAPQAGAVR